VVMALDRTLSIRRTGTTFEPVEYYQAETKDMLIAIRELCRAMAEDDLREGSAEQAKGDMRWLVKVKR